MTGTDIKKYDFLIVGAGLYGAAAARVLADRGYDVLVAEKRDHVAGSAYTRDIDGICVHVYGAHVFHTSDDKVWEFVNRFAGFNDFIDEPKAFYRGDVYSLPFNMNTFREMWGAVDPETAKHIIDEQISAAGLMGHEPANLEEQAISQVGTDIYERLIKGYTEKQWGRPCAELPASIIKRIPVRFEYDNNYFDDKYQGVPLEGYTAMVQKMLEGIDVITGADLSDPDVRAEMTGRAEKVIWSGQIDEYYDYCYGPLEYRGLKFEMINIKRRGYYQDRAVVNYTDRDIPWTRVVEHRHFLEDVPGAEKKIPRSTIITREYPSEWKPGDDAFYPVLAEEDLEKYGKYRSLAEKEESVFFGGRLGSYRYYDMDDAIAAALSDAEMLADRYSRK